MANEALKLTDRPSHRWTVRLSVGRFAAQLGRYASALDTQSMDLITAIPIGASAIALKPVVQDFLKRIFGPAADELGDWGRDRVHAFRMRNAAAIATAAQAMISAAGKEPSPVPLRTLLPLMEGASREDEESLQVRWAALLANAAILPSVPPRFPILLGQLSPIDAKALEAVADLEKAVDASQSTSVKRPRAWGAHPAAIRAKLGLQDDEPLDVALDTLAALGLVQRESSVRTDALQNPFITFGNEVRVSALGRRFLEACTPPSPSPTESTA